MATVTAAPSNRQSYMKFITSFANANGALQILVVSTIYSIGIGSVLGLIPQTLTDRYARINHGFTDHCHNYATKPPACQYGSADAKSAAAWSHVGLSVLLLLVNPIISSLSDTQGRKPAILLALAVSCIPAIVFYVIIVTPDMNPSWYYVSSSLIGAVSYLSITFAAVSDVVPDAIRAPAYGVLLSGYFGGYSLAPCMTIILSNDAAVAAFSLICSIIAVIAGFWYIPETLSDQIRNETEAIPLIEVETVADLNDSIEISDVQSTTIRSWYNNLAWLWQASTRPLREIAILARNRTLQLVSLGSFCSAMVFSIDATLVIYYIEDTLNVQKVDIAVMTLALGIAGIFIQGALIHPIVSVLGEKGALLLAFSCGTLHNFLYGSARTKITIYAALIVSQLTKTNIPILSSVASKQVAPNEQGRIQGALFAINAIGNGVGPILVQFIDRSTKSNFGRGSMFINASVLYAIGAVVVALIPKDSSSSSTSVVPVSIPFQHEEVQPLLEPLLPISDEHNNNNDHPDVAEDEHVDLAIGSD